MPVFGDQLSFDLSSLAGLEQSKTVLLMMEVAEETTYVRHHKKKIAYILSAMRHHAEALADAGWKIDYVHLEDPQNSGSFTGEIARAVSRHSPDRIVVTEAGEWRVAAMLESWQPLFGLPVEIRSDTRFLCTHREFGEWADGRRELIMEFFYREMRRKTGLLLEEGRPAGGRWNFDKDNRKPADADLFMPRPMRFEPDLITRDVLRLVAERFADHPGSLDDFNYAVTAADARRQADGFFASALSDFGRYEDAMLIGQPFLWHSILSPYLNSGLLDPLDLCRRAEAEYTAGRAPINSVEGYIRQILGWREYVRGIYWREGPEYVDRNFFDHRRSLPGWFWTGETNMRCLREAIGQTLATGHAHHIQRLMIIGNFALLIGADPRQVHEWYLEVYVDAYEWVELPNTLGMSQFGDGGLLGSKPYVSSGSYINRMSDYCSACVYSVKDRVGDNACPFNALYWDFLARHRDRLEGNHRLAIPYRNWDRHTREDQEAVLKQAQQFLSEIG
ncbi:cryptochrome/photolyase family protein [Novosphingobium sp. 11B]